MIEKLRNLTRKQKQLLIVRMALAGIQGAIHGWREAQINNRFDELEDRIARVENAAFRR